MSLLTIEKLSVSFKTVGGVLAVNRNINLSVHNGDRLGIMGETGCGKSVLAQALLNLLPENSVVTGSARLRGKDLLSAAPHELRRINGRKIAVVMQNAVTYLNPVMKTGEQLSEVFRWRHGYDKKRAAGAAEEMFRRVGIDPSRAKDCPFQFSGGMRQRVMLALGLAADSEMLIADEPTKGLDTETKWAVLDLLKKTLSGNIMVITHDLDTAVSLCNRIGIMYAGELVEIGPADAVIPNGKHPYTRGLIQSHPRYGLKPIKGLSPEFSMLPRGCRFHPRCEYNFQCDQYHPFMVETGKNHWVRCFLYGADSAG